MLATPAFAQAAGGGGAAGGLISFVPILLIFVIMYLLMIRPQQKKVKEHKAMVEALRRGDQVVTSGGMIGKVTKVADNEVEVELAPNVKVRVVRSTISQVVEQDRARRGVSSAAARREVGPEMLQSPAVEDVARARALPARHPDRAAERLLRPGGAGERRPRSPSSRARPETPELAAAMAGWPAFLPSRLVQPRARPARRRARARSRSRPRASTPSAWRGSGRTCATGCASCATPSARCGGSTGRRTSSASASASRAAWQAALEAVREASQPVFSLTGGASRDFEVTRRRRHAGGDA